MDQDDIDQLGDAALDLYGDTTEAVTWHHRATAGGAVTTALGVLCRVKHYSARAVSTGHIEPRDQELRVRPNALPFAVSHYDEVVRASGERWRVILPRGGPGHPWWRCQIRQVGYEENPVQLSVTLDLPPLPILDPVARRRIIAYELRAAKEDVLAGMVEHMRRLAPVATGTLRDAISVEEQAAPGDVYTIGRVYTNDTAGYAAAVEYGAKPHWAPIAPLKAWARLVLGDESAAYAIQHAIARRGTRAQPFFAPAADEATQRAPAVFHAAMARIGQQLQGASVALEPIIDALTWLVSQAEPTAKVWPADRIAVEPDDAQAIFGVANAAFSKGWSVYYFAWDRTSTSEDWSTNSESVRRHSLRLQGYMEVLDSAASRVVFRQATEHLCDVLRALPYTAADLVIDGLPEAIQDALPEVESIGPPQVTNDGLALLGDVYLTHAVSITLMVTERLPITP